MKYAFYEYIYSQDWSTHQQAIEAGLSDGTTKKYDWDGGNVDHDRTTISKPLP